MADGLKTTGQSSREAMLAPAHVRSLWEQLKERLQKDAKVTGSVLNWIESIVLPLLQSFGSHINISVLASIIVSALATGGGPAAVLAAILDNLGSIFSSGGLAPQQAEFSRVLAGAPNDVVASARMFLEAERLRLEHPHAIGSIDPYKESEAPASDPRITEAKKPTPEPTKPDPIKSETTKSEPTKPVTESAKPVPQNIHDTGKK